MEKSFGHGEDMDRRIGSQVKPGLGNKYKASICLSEDGHLFVMAPSN